MASSSHLIALCTILFISATLAKTPRYKPKAFILPVSKDPKTLQYLTQIKQRTPLVSLTLTLDLGGKFMWIDCESGYVSSTYRYYRWDTPQCKYAQGSLLSSGCDFRPPGVGCHNDSCWHAPINTVMDRLDINSELTSDVVSIQSTNGKNATRDVSVPEFLFFCTRKELLDGLASGVKGIAGLGTTNISLPNQISKLMKYHRIFALCLSPSSKGVVFLGKGPYVFLPNAVNAASSLTYTRLITNRGLFVLGQFRSEPSPDYYIGVTSIKINGKVIPINTTLFSIDYYGDGGTMISTMHPYTVLEDSIYDAVVKAFVEATSNATRVASVAPFEVCYSSNSFGSTRVGPVVPVIDLVLQSEKVYWRIYGANSMVQVRKDVMCLGFVKQGLVPKPHAIVIGGYQLENNLLQFNIAKKRLGFSSTLLSQQTTCSNFNFTSIA